MYALLCECFKDIGMYVSMREPWGILKVSPKHKYCTALYETIYFLTNIYLHRSYEFTCLFL